MSNGEREGFAGLKKTVKSSTKPSKGQSKMIAAFPQVTLPLPAGWRRARLDDIARRGSGHTPSQDKPEYWNGGIKWVSLADSWRLDRGYIYETEKEISAKGIAHSSAVLHSAETVILSRDAGIGKSAVLKAEMAVSQHFIAWNCADSGTLEPWFLYAWLQQNKPFFERMAVGSTIKTIGLPLFRRLTIDFPPRDEQRAVVNILRTWDEAINRSEQIVQALVECRNALSSSLLSEGHRKGSAIEFGDILKESRLSGSDGSLAHKITVKLYGKGAIEKSENYSGSANTRYYIRNKGQLLYSKLDFLNGAFAIIPDSLDGFETTLDLPAFDISPEVNSAWLIEYLTRPSYYTKQVSLARGQRKARRISPEEFLNSKVRLPDRNTQDRLAKILSDADEEIALAKERQNALERQKRGLMQKLLTGEWRVKQ